MSINQFTIITKLFSVWLTPLLLINEVTGTSIDILQQPLNMYCYCPYCINAMPLLLKTIGHKDLKWLLRSSVYVEDLPIHLFIHINWKKDLTYPSSPWKFLTLNFENLQLLSRSTYYRLPITWDENVYIKLAYRLAAIT